MQQIFDTHRLSYKNARLRAFKLDNKTERLHWFNITETNTSGDDIGVIVYTNENGYICYGQNRQRVTGLAVAESAIIQVSLDGGINWPIEWIYVSGKELTQNDIGRLYYEDGSIAFDPLQGDSKLRDFALRSEFTQGFWAEEELRLDDESTAKLSEWTKVVYINNTLDHRKVQFVHTNVRHGQLILVHNLGEAPLTFTGISGLGENFELNAGASLLCVAYTRSNGTCGLVHAMSTPTVYTSYAGYAITGDNHTLDFEERPGPKRVTWQIGASTSYSVKLENLPDGVPVTLVFDVEPTEYGSNHRDILLYVPNGNTYKALYGFLVPAGDTAHQESLRVTRRGYYYELESIQVI